MNDIRTFVAQKLLFPVVKIYWKVFRPRTFGVKGVVARADDHSILLVRHSYGDRSIWSLPGGGYRPRHETPDAAVARELHEELDLQVSATSHLGDYRTQAQGKRDTVSIFLCQVQDDGIKRNSELEDARWFSPSELAELDPLYPITRQALELYDARLAECSP